MYFINTKRRNLPEGVVGFSGGVGIVSFCYIIRVQIINPWRAKTVTYSSLKTPKQCTAWFSGQS